MTKHEIYEKIEAVCRLRKDYEAAFYTEVSEILTADPNMPEAKAVAQAKLSTMDLAEQNWNESDKLYRVDIPLFLNGLASKVGQILNILHDVD